MLVVDKKYFAVLIIIIIIITIIIIIIITIIVWCAYYTMNTGAFHKSENRKLEDIKS